MPTKTLNIALNETLIKQIDKAVKKDFSSRSEYFRRLALADLERRARWEIITNYGQNVGKEMQISSEEEIYALINDK